MHEGTPIGLVLYPPTVQAAQDRNLRPILVARPGYERSTPRPGRRVGDVAADVAAHIKRAERGTRARCRRGR
jgi:hypothetical protein